MSTMLSHLVEKAAKALDSLIPEWYLLIDTKKLDLGNWSNCILGQITMHPNAPSLFADRRKVLWESIKTHDRLRISEEDMKHIFDNRSAEIHWQQAIHTRLRTKEEKEKKEENGYVRVIAEVPSAKPEKGSLYRLKNGHIVGVYDTPTSRTWTVISFTNREQIGSFNELALKNFLDQNRAEAVYVINLTSPQTPTV